MNEIKFPHLTRFVELIASDNGIPMRKTFDWPELSCQYEALAKKLSLTSVDCPELYHDGPYANEFEIIACGEALDMEALIKSKELGDLHLFLNDIFDGQYSKNFYEL